MYSLQLPLAIPGDDADPYPCRALRMEGWAFKQLYLQIPRGCTVQQLSLPYPLQDRAFSFRWGAVSSAFALSSHCFSHLAYPVWMQFLCMLPQSPLLGCGCVCFHSHTVTVSFAAQNNKGLVERVLLSSLFSSFVPSYYWTFFFQYTLNAKLLISSCFILIMFITGEAPRQAI